MAKQMILSFDVENQTLKRKDENKIVEKSKNYVHAIFFFTEEWDDTQKAAIIENGGMRFKVYLENNECDIPNRAVSHDGFTITIVGEDEEKNITITTTDLFIAVQKNNASDIQEEYIKNITSDTLDLTRDGENCNLEIPESYKNYYVVTSDDITDFTPLGSNEFEITLSEELENVITDFKQGIYIDWATLFPDIPYSYNVCCYVPTKKVVLDGKIHYLLSCVDSLIDATLSFYKIDNQWKLSMIEANLVDRETLNYEVSQLTGAIDGKSTVIPNPTLAGTEATLEGAEIDGIKYKVGGGGKLYLHRITLPYNNNNYYVSFEILSQKNSAYTYSEIVSWLISLGTGAGWQGGVCCSTTNANATVFPLGIAQNSNVYIAVFYWDGTKIVKESLTNTGITVYDNYIEV